MVVEYAPTLVMSHPISFQVVPATSFSTYACHFLVLAQTIDMITNPRDNKRTPAKNLWNFMVIAFAGSLVPEGSRVAVIGEVTATNLVSFIFPEDIKLIIQGKIAANSHTTF